MQSSARPRRPTRRPQTGKLHRNKNNEDDNDQTVAQQQREDHGCRWNDGREAGKNQECRERENESRANDDHSEATGRAGVIQQTRAPRVDYRRSSQIGEPKAKVLRSVARPLTPPWQSRNDVAQLRRCRRRVRQYADPARRRHGRTLRRRGHDARSPSLARLPVYGGAEGAALRTAEAGSPITPRSNVAPRTHGARRCRCRRSSREISARRCYAPPAAAA